MTVLGNHRECGNPCTRWLVRRVHLFDDRERRRADPRFFEVLTCERCGFRSVSALKFPRGSAERFREEDLKP